MELLIFQQNPKLHSKINRGAHVSEPNKFYQIPTSTGPSNLQSISTNFNPIFTHLNSTIFSQTLLLCVCINNTFTPKNHTPNHPSLPKLEIED